MKLCKDCVYGRPRMELMSIWGPQVATWIDAKCAHLALVSPVDGRAFRNCSVARAVGGACGAGAALFERKTPEFDEAVTAVKEAREIARTTLMGKEY